MVRIGPTTSPDCSVIRSAVLRHFRSAADADDAGDGPPGPANDDGGDELVVSNRYFDACVRLVDLDSPPVAGEAAEDGVVLVFDSTAAQVLRGDLVREARRFEIQYYYIFQRR